MFLYCRLGVASFPGPAQLSAACFKLGGAGLTKSWAGPWERGYSRRAVRVDIDIACTL